MPWGFLSRRRSQPTPEPVVQRRVEIDRRIVQDPSSLLDSQEQDAFPRALTPSTRLPLPNASNRPRHRPQLVDHTVDITPRTQPKSTITRFSKLAAGGEWSTFGRKRDRGAPDSPGTSGNPGGTPYSPSSMRDGKHLSVESTFTLSRVTNPSRVSDATHEPPSSPSSRSPQQSPVQSSSPTDTMSSKRHPRTPQKPSSNTAPAVPSITDLTCSQNRERALDSPHTFGHPTPPGKSADFSPPYPPPPPLPPLDHPELTALIVSRRKTMSTSQSTAAFRDRSNTLPTNRRSPHRDDLFPSLSLRLERSLRHQSSLPHPKQASNIEPPEESSKILASEGRRRARTISGGSRQRRTSADWSSYQATVGVTSHANQAWPAEVSREILRLSLSRPDRVPGSSVKLETSARVLDADPVRTPDRGNKSPSFLPFPHSSRPVSPPPLSASATFTDGRDITPSRPHSLQFNLGNRRDSDRPTRHIMADVKRSLSAIEPRRRSKMLASGATCASLGLVDPVPTPSDASQAPQPSLARIPSRSLFSGRVFPTDTPMSSSIQGEPSTPTPESRQPSDKSRGKRKAEDNIDVTPPEQKKEVQRATFLLPTESRSQRVSNSSHAPSSYHRKRARLSSTSPFATPVQSRPTSVVETPQSGSRSHYFASFSSSTGARIAPRTPSRAASTRSHQPPTPSTTRKHDRRQSMSQASIPISAYISPHAPSISRSTKFHMRDPRKPPKKPNDTPWGLRFATEDEPGSPIQAWCFFLGFLLFPIWWIAGLFLRVPTTRIAGDAEKGVPIDDPQIEHDARIWRFRCRVMTAVSLFTYIPFIVLIAIFAPR